MPEDTSAVVWEYRVAKIHARHEDVLEKALNEQGVEGWEVVFMCEPVSCEYRCVFRRPSKQ